MTRSSIDPERLAALLDGRLSAADRDTLLAELAGSDDDTLAAYADAAGVAAELAPSPDTVPVRSRRWRSGRPWTVATLAVAAGVIALLLVPRMVEHGHSGNDSGTFVASLGSAALIEIAPPPWSAVRGPTTMLAPMARAIRVGAGLTDFELARRSAHSQRQASEAASNLADLLDGFPGGAAIAAVYRDVQPTNMMTDGQAAAARRAAAGIAGVDGTRGGAWIEAARVAAIAHDTGYFEGAASTRVLDVLARRFPRGPAHDALEEVRVAIHAPARNWSAVYESLTNLLVLTGS